MAKTLLTTDQSTIFCLHFYFHKEHQTSMYSACLAVSYRTLHVFWLVQLLMSNLYLIEEQFFFLENLELKINDSHSVERSITIYCLNIMVNIVSNMLQERYIFLWLQNKTETNKGKINFESIHTYLTQI